MLWILVFAMPMLFLETILHESSHAFVALNQHMDVRSFKFWPHLVDNDPVTPDLHFWQRAFWVELFWDRTPQKEFFFWGRVECSATEKYEETPAGSSTRAWAPMYSGMFLWALVGSLINLLGEFQWYDWALVTYYGAVTVDLENNLLKPLWRKERGDFNKGAQMIGLPRAVSFFLGPFIGLIILTGTGLTLWKALPW